jgi:hypothetical protein
MPLSTTMTGPCGSISNATTSTFSRQPPSVTLVTTSSFGASVSVSQVWFNMVTDGSVSRSSHSWNYCRSRAKMYFAGFPVPTGSSILLCRVLPTQCVHLESCPLPVLLASLEWLQQTLWTVTSALEMWATISSSPDLPELENYCVFILKANRSCSCFAEWWQWCLNAS